MTDQEFKHIIAQNIARYRKHAGLTQLDLAEKLSYSDKAVSKWERGESLPDTYVLYCMTEIFDITINDLISAETEKITDNTPNKLKKRRFITSLSAGLVWLVVSVVFFALELFNVTAFKPEYLFLYAIPATFIVVLVFSCVWWGLGMQAVSVSGIIWSTAACIYITFKATHISFIFITAAILQVLAVLWFLFRKHIKNSEK